MAKSMLRRMYDWLALLAVLHAVGLVGAVAYAYSTGAIDASKFPRAWSLLRGRDAETGKLQNAETKTAHAGDTKSSEDMQTDARMPEDLQILRRESERTSVELNQQLALVKSMMLKVTTEREAFRKEQEEAAARAKRETQEGPESLRRAQAAGFKKQVEIFEGLEPKVALEHLLGLQDPDEAAKLLAVMDSRKVQKIVAAAKTPERSQKMGTILQRVQDMAPSSAAETEIQE